MLKNLPTAFGYGFFVRVIIPGSIGAILLWPYIGDRLFSSLEGVLGELDATLKLIAIFALITLIGLLTSMFGHTIYMLLEGRLLWPDWLRGRGVKRLNKKISAWMTRAAEVKRSDRAEYNEIWYRLRSFPYRKAGEPEAFYPTRLGNLLHSYEQYSLNRYGMDGVFYWYRIWLVVEDVQGKRLERASAEADTLIFSSFVLLLGGLLYLINGFWLVLNSLSARPLLPPLLDFNLLLHPLTLGVLAIAIGYAVYRMALPLHRDYGELFKSLFDVYREKLKARLTLNVGERTDEFDFWNNQWRWLQYLKGPKRRQALRQGKGTDEKGGPEE